MVKVFCAVGFVVVLTLLTPFKKNPTVESHETLAPHVDSASLQLRNRTSLSVECDKSLVPHDDLVSLQVANSKHFLRRGIFSNYSKVNKDPPKVDEKIVQEHRLRLEERLLSFNVVEHQVVGDGYCQYRTLSYLLFDTDDRYLEIKEQAIQQIINIRDTYQIYLLDEDFDLYLNKIRIVIVALKAEEPSTSNKEKAEGSGKSVKGSKRSMKAMGEEDYIKDIAAANVLARNIFADVERKDVCRPAKKSKE